MIKLILSLLLVVLLLSLAQPASAGPGSGNGGKGVLIGGKPYLLDLVEGGEEMKPYFKNGTVIDPKIRKRVAVVFKDQPTFPVDLIAAKLSEVMEANYSYGLLMLKTMELYQWRLVDHEPTFVNDQREGVTVAPSDYVQLAERLESSIVIYADAWTKMDEGNRTALVFHEINYAFAKPFKKHDGYMTQDVGAVQEFTAYLFSPGFNVSDWTTISMLRNIFPEDFFFAGDWLVKESANNPRVELTPEARFIELRQINSVDGKMLWSASAIGFKTIESADALAEAAEDSVCEKLPKRAPVYIKDVLISQQTKFLSLERYEGSPDTFYSYVKITKAPQGVFYYGQGHLINADNCKTVIRMLTQDIWATLLNFTPTGD